MTFKTIIMGIKKMDLAKKNIKRISVHTERCRKKVINFFLIVLLSTPITAVNAGGINLEGLGIRAISMGGAFIGLADDASAIHWNPAGLSQLKGSGYTFGVYSMTAKIDAKNGVTNRRIGDLDKPYDPNKGDLFPAFYESEPANFDDDEELWLGAATMPSFVAFKNYGRYTLAGGIFGVGGAYSSYNDKITDPVTDAEIEADVFAILGLMAVNGSIGYQVTEKFSVGVGADLLLNVWRGDVHKDYRAPDPTLDYNYDAQIRKWGYGFQGHLGMLYKFNEQWSVGATYRTGSSMKLKGDTRVSFKGGSDIRLDPFRTNEKSDGYTEFEYGASWGLGVAYKPTNKLTFTYDYRENDWSDFKWPGSNAKFDNQGVFLQNIDEDPGWTRAHGYSVGTEYLLNDTVTLRAGYTNESSGIPSEFENPVTITIGDIQIASVGIGIQYDTWKVDALVGTMWGGTGLGVDHRCYDVGISFMRMF
ncbi:MAG: outer membrane protein transport protein [Cycloclasticus sp.]